MEVVDLCRCDRCGKVTEIVRLIPKNSNDMIRPTTYIILCRACLANDWAKESREKETAKGT